MLGVNPFKNMDPKDFFDSFGWKEIVGYVASGLLGGGGGALGAKKLIDRNQDKAIKELKERTDKIEDRTDNIESKLNLEIRDVKNDIEKNTIYDKERDKADRDFRKSIREAIGDMNRRQEEMNKTLMDIWRHIGTKQ